MGPEPAHVVTGPPSGSRYPTKLRTLVQSIARIDAKSALWIFGLALGTLGLLSRLVLAWLSVGCDDVDGWRYHATVVGAHGVRFAYETTQDPVWKFNHPPLMGYWAALAGRMSASDIHTFTLWMKVPGLLVELVSATLIYRIWAKPDRVTGALAFAAYGLSLPLILVSGYHCNTDTAYAGLTLLAMYWMEHTRRPFWSGIALAAALNVKLLPIFLVPALFAQCRSLRELLRFGAGLVLAILPYVPFLATSASAMYVNMISYNSLQLDWGLNAFLQSVAATPAFAEYATKPRELFVPNARYAILLLVVVFSLISAVRRRRGGYELGALAWALFLVLTPGYGVQYAVCVLPLLFAADRKHAILYSANAGIMMFFIYTAQMKFEFPLQARVQYFPLPPVAVLFGVLAWTTLVVYVFATARKILTAPTNAR